MAMKLNDKEYGMFGTSNGSGRILGSVLYITIVNSINRKWTLVITLLFKGLSLYAMSISTNLWIMIGIRGLLGIQHVLFILFINYSLGSFNDIYPCLD